MYYLDPNQFMNGAVAGVLTIGVLIFVAAVVRGVVLKRSGRLTSYLYMLTAMIAIFGAGVGLLGLRGRASGENPWHFLLDMKYQAKYTAQGESEFFADGRAMRMTPPETVPFDGTVFSADAGFHSGPKAGFLKEDGVYYRGTTDPAGKEVAVRIPDRAVNEAEGWESLIKRGRQQFNIHCAACHGASGRGGGGADAHGIVGAYNLSVAPADVTAATLHSQPDGQLFNTIGHGKGLMPGYGNQVKTEDRWAIVAYIRVLQFARK
jgi:mono/diheme cytochrome c family protein